MITEKRKVIDLNNPLWVIAICLIILVVVVVLTIGLSVVNDFVKQEQQEQRKKELLEREPWRKYERR